MEYGDGVWWRSKRLMSKTEARINRYRKLIYYYINYNVFKKILI